MKTPILQSESIRPLYKQLMQKLRMDINNGIYPVHSRIPSEQELCETYGVSRVTVRKALAELTRDGLLMRRQGKGTFVSSPRLYSDLRDLTSFSEACRLMGCEATTRVIHAQRSPATDADREMLGCAGDQVIEVVRLRQADDLPVMIETNRFPPEFEWLLEEKLTSSLYKLLEKQHFIASRGTHQISLTYATQTQARLLSIEPGSALLRLEQVIYDQGDRPLHTSHQVIRGDRFTFRI